MPVTAQPDTILNRDGVELRARRGLVLIGSRPHPVLGLWQRALRQERPHVETVRLLREADRGDWPTRRAWQSRMHTLPSRSQPRDVFSATAIVEAIETGRLAAVYLPDDLTILSPSRHAGVPLSPPKQEEDTAPDRLSPARRVDVMLRRAAAFLETDIPDLNAELTGPEPDFLSNKLVSLAIPDGADLRVFMDASLAGLAYAIAGWTGLEALHRLTQAIRAAMTALRLDELDEAARTCAGALDILGARFPRIVQRLRLRRGDKADSAEVDTGPRPLQQRMRDRTASDRDADDFPDGAAQARALQAAAQAGTPFCEICGR